MSLLWVPAIAMLLFTVTYICSFVCLFFVCFLVVCFFGGFLGFFFLFVVFCLFVFVFCCCCFCLFLLLFFIYIHLSRLLFEGRTKMVSAHCFVVLFFLRITFEVLLT